MRLLDLDPRWLLADDDQTKIGFAFRVPTKPQSGEYQTCFFSPTLFKAQCRAIAKAFPELEWDDEDREYGRPHFQTCRSDCKWSADVHDFATISVTPSLDGSAGGNWHGFVTNGEIVGGLP